MIRACLQALETERELGDEVVTTHLTLPWHSPWRRQRPAPASLPFGSAASPHRDAAASRPRPCVAAAAALRALSTASAAASRARASLPAQLHQSQPAQLPPLPSCCLIPRAPLLLWLPAPLLTLVSRYSLSACELAAPLAWRVLASPVVRWAPEPSHLQHVCAHAGFGPGLTHVAMLTADLCDCQQLASVSKSGKVLRRTCTWTAAMQLPRTCCARPYP